MSIKNTVVVICVCIYFSLDGSVIVKVFGNIWLRIYVFSSCLNMYIFLYTDILLYMQTPSRTYLCTHIRSHTHALLHIFVNNALLLLLLLLLLLFLFIIVIVIIIIIIVILVTYFTVAIIIVIIDYHKHSLYHTFSLYLFHHHISSTPPPPTTTPSPCSSIVVFATAMDSVEVASNHWARDRMCRRLTIRSWTRYHLAHLSLTLPPCSSTILLLLLMLLLLFYYQ